ncbi:hypothetical protein HYU09_01495 [Candidatus Woesearchaeota archaeon]|nr:hypothetical protein [Candidatus Woesearchaeota archaeon]
MATNLELRILELAKLLSKKRLGFPDRIRVAYDLMNLAAENRAEIEYLRRSGNSFYVLMKKVLEAFAKQLKTLMVRRKQLLEDMKGKEFVEKMLESFPNRPLTGKEIGQIRQIHMEEAGRLARVNIDKYVERTNMLIGARKQIEAFAKKL